MPSPQVARWLDRLAARPFLRLFDRLPGTMLFAKDEGFRLMLGNPAFVERCGCSSEDELVGRTDDELFPEQLANKYRQDDERVLRTGEPLYGLIELFPDRTGQPAWSITDKLPLHDKHDNVRGICGIVRSYEREHAALQPYLELSPVAEHLKKHYRQRLDLRRLADMCGMSTRQFSRKFRATFQMTPRAYIMQLRVLRACDLLRTTTTPITEIALESGFYDHADFARHFRKHMAVTASDYRRAQQS